MPLLRNFRHLARESTGQNLTGSLKACPVQPQRRSGSTATKVGVTSRADRRKRRCLSITHCVYSSLDGIRRRRSLSANNTGKSIQNCRMPPMDRAIVLVRVLARGVSEWPKHCVILVLFIKSRLVRQIFEIRLVGRQYLGGLLIQCYGFRKTCKEHFATAAANHQI
jgi:hypothetical protein